MSSNTRSRTSSPNPSSSNRSPRNTIRGRGAAGRRGRIADGRQGGLEGQQVTVQVADDPQRDCGIQDRDPDHLVGRIGTVAVEQQARPAGPIEQGLHALDDPAHPAPDGRRIDGRANSPPIQAVDLHDLQGRGVGRTGIRRRALRGRLDRRGAGESAAWSGAGSSGACPSGACSWQLGLADGDRRIRGIAHRDFGGLACVGFGMDRLRRIGFPRRQPHALADRARRLRVHRSWS